MMPELFNEDLDRIAVLLRDIQAVADRHKVGFAPITAYIGAEGLEITIGLDLSGSIYVLKAIK